MVILEVEIVKSQTNLLLSINACLADLAEGPKIDYTCEIIYGIIPRGYHLELIQVEVGKCSLSQFITCVY